MDTWHLRHLQRVFKTKLTPRKLTVQNNRRSYTSYSNKAWAHLKTACLLSQLSLVSSELYTVYGVREKKYCASAVKASPTELFIKLSSYDS